MILSSYIKVRRVFDLPKEFSRARLSKFSSKMVGWGKLPVESITLFVENMAAKIGIEPKRAQKIVVRGLFIGGIAVTM